MKAKSSKQAKPLKEVPQPMPTESNPTRLHYQLASAGLKKEK